jgi:hypothetical protein
MSLANFLRLEVIVIPPDCPPFRCAQHEGQKRNLAHKIACAKELCAMLAVLCTFRVGFCLKTPKFVILTCQVPLADVGA